MNRIRMTTTNSIILALIVVLFAGCSKRSDTVVELPRPNSGEFTVAQAEARKSEIYSLARSGLKADWKNPYSGFCVHITQEDEVVVYGNFYPFHQNGKLSISQLENVVTNYPLLGNPLGVLVTSERDPGSSATLPRVVDVLFKPQVQIFYCRN